MNEHLNIILGGYVGLFIGYTIAQAPTLLLNLVTWIDTVKNRMRIQSIETNITEE